MFRIVLLGGVNRIGGVALGFLEGAFIVCMALYFGASKPVPEKFKRIYPPFKDSGTFSGDRQGYSGRMGRTSRVAETNGRSEQDEAFRRFEGLAA